MPPPWKRFLIELFGEHGYEGRWIGEPSPERQFFDDTDRERWVTRELVNWIRPRAIIRYAQDGEDLIIGIFNDGYVPTHLVVACHACHRVRRFHKRRPTRPGPTRGLVADRTRTRKP